MYAKKLLLCAFVALTFYFSYYLAKCQKIAELFFSSSKKIRTKRRLGVCGRVGTCDRSKRCFFFFIIVLIMTRIIHVREHVKMHYVSSWKRRTSTGNARKINVNVHNIWNIIIRVRYFDFIMYTPLLCGYSRDMTFVTFSKRRNVWLTH
jgi:hypothetical protein